MAGAGARPDELMIDWGRIPVGSVASIYWPQVNAADVISLAASLYSTHTLAAADTHTIQCKVTGGVTYVPIPAGAGENFAGCFTVGLPEAVVEGTNVLRQKGPGQVSPFAIPALSGSMAGAQVTMIHRLTGPLITQVAACASGVIAFQV